MTVLWLEETEGLPEFDVLELGKHESKLPAGKELTIEGDVNTVAKKGSARPWSSTSIKVLATADYYEPAYFNHLKEAPETGQTWDKRTANTRGDSDTEDELLNLLGEASLGATRGFKKKVKKTRWATQILQFDVGHPPAADGD